MSQRRFAYLMGANGPQTNRLKYAEKDVTCLAEALQAPPCSFTQVEWTIAASRDETLIGLGQFAQQCGPTDLLLVHFSGHAYYDQSLYLLCNDTRTEYIKILGIEIGAIKRILQECPASHKLLVLDCCHSGAALAGAFKGADDHGLMAALQETMHGSASAILAACSRSERARELEMLDDGAGFLSWGLRTACSSSFHEASPDGRTLSLSDIWSWLFVQLAAINTREQLPEPLLLNEMRGGESGDFWFTDAHRKRTQQDLDDQPDDEQRVRAMLADHSSFLRDRLASFVGRQHELAEIRHFIAERVATGGYVTITGQAGQGKSSMIAKLIEERGAENCAFHFIPFNPGPDHQVGLLRNLMAYLTLKYHLPTIYVATESRATLRDYFPKILSEVAAKGGHEIIFIDGLDQLEEEISGTRDLSFLPTNPPPGIVFVLGTRPNDTLKPLALLKPHDEYILPNLSREDFDLILQHRGVQLEKVLADQFYQAMQENALYLDLVAKELAENRAKGSVSPHEIFKQLAENPEKLFSLAMARLKRQPAEWREVIKPILGLLLVAREPLSGQHLRQIIGVEADRFKEGIERLGGLITDNGQQCYALFHLKLRDYLRQAEDDPHKDYVFAIDEEQGWHQRLAQWCEQGNIPTIWHDSRGNPSEQKRREYARQHHLTHLYHAHAWSRLFEFLDASWYGRAKMQYDPGMRSYVLDLDIGRQAAAWEGWSIDEGIALLPHLWRYTLLLCSLNSRADNYTPEAFEALLMLGRVTEAVSLAELLTQPVYKASVLLRIGRYLCQQAGREEEGLQFLQHSSEIIWFLEVKEERDKALRALELAFIEVRQWERAEEAARALEEDWARTEALRALGHALAQAQEWQRAMSIMYTLPSQQDRVWALQELSMALIDAQEWERAISVIRSLEDERAKAETLRELGAALTRAQQQELAAIIWQEAEQIIFTLEPPGERSTYLQSLAMALADAQEWQHAEAVARSIPEQADMEQVLRSLTQCLVRAQQWSQAETIAYGLQEEWMRFEALRELAVAGSLAQQAELAAKVWDALQLQIDSLQGNAVKVRALWELGLDLVEAEQWARADTVWRAAESMALQIEEKRLQAIILRDLGQALSRTPLTERAQAVWNEAEQAARALEWLKGGSEVLRDLAIALAQARQWERATRIVHTLEWSRDRVEALQALGIAFTQEQCWEQAELVWAEAERVARLLEWRAGRADVLRTLGIALAQMQQWERAEAIISSLETYEGKAEALRESGMILIMAKQWERAETVARKLEQCEGGDTMILRELGIALAQDGQWDYAESIVRSLERYEEKAEVLRELVMALTQAQEWERAERIACSFEKSTEITEALRIVGVALAQAQEWERARTIWSEVSLLNHTPRENENRARVLRELGIALAEAKQWEQAEALARSLQEDGARSEVLRELGHALIKARQWEKAIAWATSLEWSEGRTEALRELGIALAQDHQWSLVEGVASLLEWEVDRAEVLRELAMVHSHAGEWERAEAIVRALKDDWVRFEALQELGMLLAQAGQWERAESVWKEAEQAARLLERSKDNIEALQELGVALAQAGQWERAETIARTLDRGGLVRVLRELGLALVQVHMWERAEVIWQEAEAEARALGWHEGRARVLRELGITLVHAQQWERAEAIGRSLMWCEGGVEVLRELGIALVWAKHWERAEAIAQVLGESEGRVKVLSTLGVVLAQAGEWERAEGIVRLLADTKGQARILRELGVALTQAREWTRAEEIASKLPQEKDRTAVLLSLTASLAQTQQWERAEEIARALPASKGRASALIALGMNLAQAELWQRAESIWLEAITVALAISDRKARVETLQEILDVLEIFARHELMLRLVQRAWLQADIRSYAVDLLPLAMRYIPIKPEIGPAFCESFDWVENLLKG